MQFVIESHEAELLRGILISVGELCKKIERVKCPDSVKAHAQSLYTDSRTLQAIFGWSRKEQD